MGRGQNDGAITKMTRMEKWNGNDNGMGSDGKEMGDGNARRWKVERRGAEKSGKMMGGKRRGFEEKRERWERVREKAGESNRKGEKGR